MVCENLGYIVKEKMGVPVKICCGINNLDTMNQLDLFNSDADEIISENPPIVYVQQKDLIGNSLKPSFYTTRKYARHRNPTGSPDKNFETIKLCELAEFVTSDRKNYMASDKIKHISVLHINADSTINFEEVMKFSPVSKGKECMAGDLIFSKINPRIPRMAVVPESEYSLVCSTEFEIMKPRNGIDPYLLCFLLKTDYVSEQIKGMVSGTSSSHGRIKREQLREILIPLPTDEERKQCMENIALELKKTVGIIYSGEKNLQEQIEQLENMFR